MLTGGTGLSLKFEELEMALTKRIKCVMCVIGKNRS